MKNKTCSVKYVIPCLRISKSIRFCVNEMTPHSRIFEPHPSYWSKYDLSGLNIKVKKLEKDKFIHDENIVSSYFWNKGFLVYARNLMSCNPKSYSAIHRGYHEARSLVGGNSTADIETLSFQALNFTVRVFKDIEDRFEPSKLSKKKFLPSSSRETYLSVQLKLSSDLERWKKEQHAIGNVLPPKGVGLAKASDEVLEFFGGTSWPEAIQTNNVLFGCGASNFLIGAADVPTLFSNIITDMALYCEHGYYEVFPSLETLMKKALLDPHALHTPGGCARREGVRIGKRFIQGKTALEKRNKLSLNKSSARFPERRTAQIVSLFENSLLGMGAEVIARGYDPGAVISDLIFSSSCTDVINVGSDLLNSEVMNSFLCVTNVADMGIVREDALREVYDAFAAVGARMLTERWHEPSARMTAQVYSWHIQNDRHNFLRRALLGWSKARKTPARPQREADFDEVFDVQYRTTGFSRPLDARYECNGQDTCNHVNEFLNLRHKQDKSLLRDLWWFLVVGPIEYVRRGKVDEQNEHMLIEGSRLRMAQLFSEGLIHEMAWIIAHASHHAWQINYLFEAAMFGSILDRGGQVGELDRQEEKQEK